MEFQSAESFPFWSMDIAVSDWSVHVYPHLYIHTRTHTCVYIYIYIYIFIEFGNIISSKILRYASICSIPTLEGNKQHLKGARIMKII